MPKKSVPKSKTNFKCFSVSLAGGWLYIISGFGISILNEQGQFQGFMRMRRTHPKLEEENGTVTAFKLIPCHYLSVLAYYRTEGVFQFYLENFSFGVDSHRFENIWERSSDIDRCYEIEE